MSDEETYKTFSDDDISVICGFERDRLKAENERLREALEDCREASGYINGESEVPRIVKAALKEQEHD